MKKLFFATSNKYKIQNMKDRLKETDIELITPYDINLCLEVEEDGETVTENAILKAKPYYDKLKIPTIAGDTALYVEKFEKQPGLYARRVNGKYLNDEELEKYYIEELIKIGGESKAYYNTGLALIINDEIKIIEIKEDEFIMKAQICKAERKNDVLGRIAFDTKLNKYFCEMTEEDKNKSDNVFDKKCLEFILDNINNWKNYVNIV